MPTRSSRSRRVAGGAALVAMVAAALVALAALLDLGPFGGDDPSPAALVERGDEICRDAHDDFARLQEDPPATAAEAVDLTEELVAISEDELERIGDLAVPPALERRLGRYLSAREAGIDLLREGLEAARSEDAFAYAAAQAELARSQAERAELARAVGFEECSSPLTSRAELAEDAEPPAPTDPGAPPTVGNPATEAP